MTESAAALDLLAAAPAATARPERGTAGNSAARFLILQLLAVILLQKLALRVGEGEIELLLPIYLCGIAVMAFRGQAMVTAGRLLAYLALVILAVAAAMLTGRDFSPGALMLFLVVYLPMLFVVPIDEAGYHKVIRFFIAAMMVITPVIIVEWGFNLTIGHSHWPNLERVIPAALTYSNFNYIQPVVYGSSQIKPNAIVFLEVSYLSQFLALALICEAALYRRLIPLAVLTVGLLLTFAGTGLVVLMLTVPFLLPRLDRQLLLVGGILGIALLAVAGTTGWLDTIARRSTEIVTPRSSGYERYTASILMTAQNLASPENLVTGAGPGNVPTQNVNSLPVTKLISEYGLLTTIAFFLFFCVSLFAGTRNLPLAVGLFWFFHLGGGSLSMPLCVLLCVLLGTAVVRLPGAAQAAPGQTGRVFPIQPRHEGAGDSGARE